MKIGLNALPPFTFRAAILPASGLLVLLAAAAVGQRVLLSRAAWGPLLVSAFLNVTCWHVLTAFGLSHMDAGRAAIIAYTMPLWVAILARLFRAEPFDARRAAALALGTLGIGALLYPDWTRIGAHPEGPLFMIGAAITWAGGTLWQKHARQSTPLLTQTGWQLLAGGAPVVAAALIFDEPSAMAWSPAVVLLIAYLAIVPTCFCYWAWYKVVALFSAQVAAIGMMMVPVVGVLSGIAVLREPFGAADLAALFLVTAAIALVLTEQRKA